MSKTARKVRGGKFQDLARIFFAFFFREDGLEPQVDLTGGRTRPNLS
jgi:hypothetical protein